MSRSTVRRRTRALLVFGLALLAAAGADSAERYWPPIVDPATHQYTPGRWVWADLVTSDVAAAAGFYARVFGWTFETYGPHDDFQTYTLVLSCGTPIGGIVYSRPKQPEKFPSSRWVGLVSVEDVAAAAARAEKAGGRVVIKPTELGARGTEALLMDP